MHVRETAPIRFIPCQTTTKQALQISTNYTSIQNRKKPLQFAQASTIIHTKRRFLSFGTERPAKSLIGKGAARRIRNCVCLAGNRQGIFFARAYGEGGIGVKLKAQIMDEAALRRALMRISHEIAERNKGV